MGIRGNLRRDSKRRVLRAGESIRADGKYQFKYYVNGKAKFVYSWKLEPTDRLPAGKKPCLSLRELEKQVGYDLDAQMDPTRQSMTVIELVERYLSTKTGVKPSTRANYNFVRNLLNQEDFAEKKIGHIKTSDAKLFLIRLQDAGKGYSTVKTVRGVLRPAFQMAVDDDILNKNPFGFQLAGVVVNDSVTRETGMRISEFCGLTLKDIDLENRIVNIDHQLQRTSEMEYIVESTKTNSGTRKLPITEDVAQCFAAIIEDREPPAVEKFIDGYGGFLFYDDKGMPLVAMHWEHRFNNMVDRYNATPHVCRHTYCSNQARAGMNPKTLQYLMGHSDIGVTMNVYTHLGLEDAADELKRIEAIELARKEIEKQPQEKELLFRTV